MYIGHINVLLYAVHPCKQGEMRLCRNWGDKWHELALKNMRVDSSWQSSAAQYIDIYNHVLTL